jgi:hypothetical protein
VIGVFGICERRGLFGERCRQKVWLIIIVGVCLLWWFRVGLYRLLICWSVCHCIFRGKRGVWVDCGL